MATISSAYVGWDRYNPPTLAWLQTLYRNSNFRFLGAYLSHAPNPTRRTDWFRPFHDIMGLGYGACLWYLGYSYRPDPTRIVNAASRDIPEAQRTAADYHESPSAVLWPGITGEQNIRDLGVRHGKKIKELAHAMDNAQAGCVVIFDNEDPPNVALSSDVLLYMRSCFEELQRSGLEGPAVRPGFYSREKQAQQLLELFPDLFLWSVILTRPQMPRPNTTATRPTLINNNGRWAPWTESNNRIAFPLEPSPIRCIKYRGGLGIPLGKQGIDWKQKGLPTATLGHLTTLNDWDFDMSLVRDPRYPCANPRMAIHGYLLRGTFQGSMLVEQVAATNAMQGTAQLTTGPVALGGDTIEPEAPIVTAGERVLSINTSAAVVIAARSHNTWSAFAAVPNTRNALRRIRALTAVVRNGQVHVFFVNADHRLVTRHGLPWTDEVVVGMSTLHPFSNITCVNSAYSMDAFFINENGALCTTTPVIAASKTYPAQNIKILDSTPTLLSGTALASVAASDSQILVFGVGRNLKLRMYAWTRNSGWSESVEVGDRNARLCAHSRLAAFASDPRTVLVAGISDTNKPCVYTFTGPPWRATPRTVHEQVRREIPRDYHEPVPPGPFTQAFTFDVNPYGDVVLGRDDRGLLLGVAGVAPGEGAMLVCRVASGAWMRVR